jgi:hypothetical protein
VFEEELELDSSFPLGPEDLAASPDVAPPQLDELDYANVFGPVTGSLAVPDLDPEDDPARPGYVDDLYVFDDDQRHPVPPPLRSAGRRRELVVLGLAAGIVVALGVGSQVFSRSGDRSPTEAASDSSSTSTTRLRARATDATQPPDLTLPSLGPEGSTPTVVGAAPGTKTSTTKAHRTTTTVKRTTTTAAPAAPPPTDTTTTTAPQDTTTTTATTIATTTTAPP